MSSSLVSMIVSISDSRRCVGFGQHSPALLVQGRRAPAARRQPFLTFLKLLGFVRRATAQTVPVEITSIAVGEIPDADIKLKVKEPTVLAMDRLRFQPGGSTPWHYHPGAAFVIVTAGAVTEYTDDGCMNVIPAGSAFFEEAGRVHRVSNDAGVVAEIFGTLVLPWGFPPLIVVPEPAPATCHGRH